MEFWVYLVLVYLVKWKCGSLFGLYFTAPRSLKELGAVEMLKSGFVPLRGTSHARTDDFISGLFPVNWNAETWICAITGHEPELCRGSCSPYNLGCTPTSNINFLYTDFPQFLTWIVFIEIPCQKGKVQFLVPLPQRQQQQKHPLNIYEQTLAFWLYSEYNILYTCLNWIKSSEEEEKFKKLKLW